MNSVPARASRTQEYDIEEDELGTHYYDPETGEEAYFLPHGADEPIEGPFDDEYPGEEDENEEPGVSDHIKDLREKTEQAKEIGKPDEPDYVQNIRLEP